MRSFKPNEVIQGGTHPKARRDRHPRKEEGRREGWGDPLNEIVQAERSHSGGDPPQGNERQDAGIMLV